VPGFLPARPVAEKSEDSTQDVDDLELVSLYLFGVAHSIGDLSNAALSKLATQNEHSKCTTTIAAVQRVFAHPVHVQRLCKFLTEEAARRLNAGNVPMSIVRYPAEYVQRILQKKLIRSSVDVDKMDQKQWTSQVCSHHFRGDSIMPGSCKKAC